ncbi:MAG TPA: Gfo/Idh/MocA family oxidoreductase [Candidatus Angelobacter sp.]|nr:Gfo/Idh/MocA family oxidoreductase [Candidatus Angelobacter sp.]
MKKQVTFSRHSRRQFIRYSSLAVGGTVLTGPYLLRARNLNDKVNIAQIGAGGKGSSDTDCCSSENIVALCDVDQRTLDNRHQKYPGAKVFRDYRKMLDQIHRDIDAVIVSAPDNHHACAAIMAMKLGKHVYCQKPLTISVYEARLMRKVAADKKVVTQMGNQGSSESGLRRAVEVIQAGAIGSVHQVHVWSNRPIWPQGMDRPPGSDPVPPTLDWDLWIGPAPMRPYKGNRTYHDFAWRGWQDFGTGALGDMACHTSNMPFRALKLGYPTEVQAETSHMNRESYPLKSKIRFEFPAREGLAPAQFWWYDGGNPRPNDPYAHDGNNKPPKDITADIEEMLGKMPGSGCLLIGDKGKLFSPDDYGAKFFIKLKDDKEYTDGTKHEAVKDIPQTIPRNTLSPDTDRRHHLEWIDAIKKNDPLAAYSRFDIAAYLTEIILLGDVAMRAGQKLEWDGPNMKAKNTSAAEQFVKRQFRKGWKL